jgi:hypothetical protein
MQVDPAMRVVEHGPPVEGMTHKGKPVPSYIVNGAGKRAAFDRIAMEDKGGGVPLSQLRKDECVIAPGLVYRDVQ